MAPEGGADDVAACPAAGGDVGCHSGESAVSPLVDCCGKDANAVPSLEPPDLCLRLYGPRFIPFFLSLRVPSWH
jgi:hypothetical protein